MASVPLSKPNRVEPQTPPDVRPPAPEPFAPDRPETEPFAPDIDEPDRSPDFAHRDVDDIAQAIARHPEAAS